MKKILPLLLILLFIIFSCNKVDKPVKTDEEKLTGTWTIKKNLTHWYLNGEPDRIEESIAEQPYSYLTFDSNKNVSYTNPSYTNEIKGQWDLDEKALRTSLKIDMSSSSGYSTFYFFPESTIVLLNDSELVLKSPMSLESTHPNGDKIKYYSETYLER